MSSLLEESYHVTTILISFEFFHEDANGLYLIGVVY